MQFLVFLIGCVAWLGFALAVPRLLNWIADCLADPVYYPCTRLFSPRIPCRDPNVIKVGGYMLACSQWSPLLDTCKANGSGSPND